LSSLSEKLAIALLLLEQRPMNLYLSRVSATIFLDRLETSSGQTAKFWTKASQLL
jgi:hypothetical protein